MPTFLSPLLRGAPERYVLRNLRTGSIVAEHLVTAFDSAGRRTGLLKHDGFPEGSAMIIAPTNAIHTFFMKFPIDVAFVRKDGQIKKVCSRVKPWRLAGAWGAYAVIELPAGVLNRSDVHSGDVFQITERSS